MNLKKLIYTFGLFLLLLPCACTEEETDLGVGLQDPFTLYDGVRDTAYVTACTLYDDSLLTAGFSVGVFGRYADANFGRVEAVLYSQISVPQDGVRITQSVQIDSVVMTLVVDTLFPVPQTLLLFLYILLSINCLNLCSPTVPIMLTTDWPKAALAFSIAW